MPCNWQWLPPEGFHRVVPPVFPWMVTVAIINVLIWTIGSDWAIRRWVPVLDAVTRRAVHLLCCVAALLFHVSYASALTDMAWRTGQFGEPKGNRTVGVTRLWLNHVCGYVAEFSANYVPVSGPTISLLAKRGISEDVFYWFGEPHSFHGTTQPQPAFKSVQNRLLFVQLEFAELNPELSVYLFVNSNAQDIEFIDCGLKAEHEIMKKVGTCLDGSVLMEYFPVDCGTDPALGG